ncbi:MAG: LicD family protein [Desulfohalobiaceae bacterium]
MQQPAQSPLLAECLAWADRIARQADISLIVDSGTLLGLMRDGDLLSWDMDLDFAVLDRHAAGRLCSALQGIRFQTYRYQGRVYKIAVSQQEAGLGADIDFKLFAREGAHWCCPAIRAPGMWGRGRSKSSWLRRMLRPAWTELMERLDSGRPPLRWLAQVDSWVVPARFFDSLLPVPGTERCFIPAQAENYLELRYGDWLQPVQEWIPCQDDGCYLRLGRKNPSSAA